ncbi:MAG: hypothetical protein HQK63_04575 [Desulfamplus sp.]|nr:hypothetical protein [Desulfamplus sp.]
MKNRKALSGLVVAFIVSVLCVSNSFAFNAVARDDSSRVTVGQNYFGDVLLGQIYQTNWGYSTKIKVINTSSTRAVVAKVVFRTVVCSSEIFDFLLYLSPTDMWEGEVRVNAQGAVEIYSTDDSVLASPAFGWDGTAACNPFTGVWASETTPFRATFSKPSFAASHGDLNTFGHIEVFGMASYPATAPLDKDSLAIVYGLIPGLPTLTTDEINSIIACDFNLSGNALDVPNVLTGTISLENSVYDQTVTTNMTALQNWENNPLFMSTAAETSIGNSTYNSVVETEAALAKAQYVIPFDFSDATGYADIVLVNTLPTLYRGGTGGSGIFTVPGCSFTTCLTGSCTSVPVTGGLAGLGYRPYDMKETILLSYLSGPASNPPTLPEVSMQPLLPMIQRAVLAGYTKGWVRVMLPGAGSGLAADGTTRVTFTGAPILNSYINIYDNGDLDWNHAASPESTVTYGGTAVRQ